MSSDFIPQKDYKLILFNKEQKEIIKRIKKYVLRNRRNLRNLRNYKKCRNCRNDITQSYITKILNKFDYGFAFFRSEILKINNSLKNIPCAFACIQIYDNITLYLLLIYSIHNNDNDNDIDIDIDKNICADNLDEKILNEIINYAKKNNYKKILLESDEKLVKFYEKYGFICDRIVWDDMHFMIKYIE